MEERNLFYLLLFVVPVLITSCSKDDEENETSTFNLTVSGLPQPDEFHVYEGWLVLSGSMVSIGIFSINGNGEPSVSSFTADAGQLEGATEFVISIEPNPDTDAAPSNTKILGVFLLVRQQP